VIVFSTDFGPATGAPSPYYNINNAVINEWKKDGNNVTGTLTPKMSYATAAAQVGSSAYGLVRRATDVNTAYANTTSANVPMIILPSGTSNAELLSCTISGLDKDRTYTIMIDAVLAYKGTGCPNGGQGTFFLFRYRNDVSGATQDSPNSVTGGNVLNGMARNITVNNVQPNAAGELIFTLLSGTATHSNCIAAIGFTNIMVVGCPPILPNEPGDPDPCPMHSFIPSNPCDVASATMFQSNDYTGNIHNINTVKFIGAEGRLSIPADLPLATEAQKGNIGLTTAPGKVYAVVDNLYDINTNYPNIKKPMLLLPGFRTAGVNNTQILLQYFVGGLNPTKEYEVIIEGYYITSGCAVAGANNPDFSISFNGGANQTVAVEAKPLAGLPVRCFTSRATYTLPITASSLEMTLRAANNGGVAGCNQLYGITKIEIKGTGVESTKPALVPQIISSQGEEVCRNELIRFSLDKSYGACTYKWEKSPTGADNTWHEVGYSQNYMEEVTATAWYRCTINTGNNGGYGISKIFKLSVIDCCNEADGGSRVLLMHDDFGHFLSNSLYVTNTGQTITTCGGKKSIMDPTPTYPPGTNNVVVGTPNMPGVVFVQGCSYQSSRGECLALNPGNIHIGAVPALSLHYFGGNINTDRYVATGGADGSGDPNGGVLFFDVADCRINQQLEIYRRQIDHLCEGKMTYFQVDYCPANQPTRDNDRMVLSLYARNPDGSKGKLLVASPQMAATTYGWRTFKYEFMLDEGVSSVYFCIDYVLSASSAGDFMIDNVKFLVCSQPNVDAYSNIPTLQQDTTICGDATLDFGTLISDKVINAYGGEEAVRVIYQHSNDGVIWENITGIMPNLSIDLDMKMYPGAKNYFRVVVGNTSALTKFESNPDAEIYKDACRTTSISLPFIVYREGNLNMGDDETIAGCKGMELTLKGTTAAEEPLITVWEWTDALGNILVEKTNDAAKRDLTYITDGSTAVYFVGYNKTGCFARKKFNIVESTKVAITLSETKICGRTTVTATSVPSAGVTYSWRYTNGNPITTTGSSFAFNTSDYANGTVSIVGVATGYCESDTVKWNVTIDEKPLPPTVTNVLLPYPVESGSINVATEANVQPAASHTLYWRDNAGALLTPPVTQSKESPGTFTFWAGQISPEGCRSDSIQITVVISIVDVPDVRDTIICQGNSLDVSLLAKITEPGGSLVWYATINAPTGSTTAPTVPTTAPANEYYYYVSQKVGTDESQRVPIKVTVVAPPVVTISYTGSPFCTSLNTPQLVTRTGSGGGTYSVAASPGVLDINTTSGSITPSSSTPGTYNVIYTIPSDGVCGEVSNNTTVIITKYPELTISYAETPFCTSDDVQPVILENEVGAYTGGTYTTVGDLTLNSSNGNITPGSSKSGNYTVTYTIPASGGCPTVPVTTQVAVTEEPSATISYDNAPYCTSEGLQTVNFTGTTGGIYSADPAELAINANTGAITPGNSEPGDYIVTYTIAAAGGCDKVTATARVTITLGPSATISYDNAPFCTSLAGAQAVAFDGEGAYTGGEFTYEPAGLALNALNGNITPKDSEPGGYTITYTIPASNGCSEKPVTTFVEITQEPSATISYATPFCTSLDDAQPVNLANGVGAYTGGTYTADPAGLNINAVNGFITPSGSEPGTYEVTYTIPASDGCDEVEVKTTVVITEEPSATISYAGTPFCSSLDELQAVTLTPGAGAYTGGTYTADADINAIIDLNALTGEINPHNSAPGTYEITYTIPASGGCEAVPVKTTVKVTQEPSVTISYNSPFCELAEVQAVSLTNGVGVYTGGTYTSDPAGMDINALTGFITPSGSTPGTYEVTYTIPASDGCDVVTAKTSVTIHPTPTIVKPLDQTLCNGDSTNAVTFTGTPTGVTYTWENNTPAIGLAAVGSGDIAAFKALNSTTATITGTIKVTPKANGCTGESVSFDITVKPTPTVDKPSDQTLCKDELTNAVIFTGTPAGVIYKWTNNNTNIGLVDAGMGNILSFSAENNQEDSQEKATITVTPEADGCTGVPVTFTITVNPMPEIKTVTNDTICGEGTVVLKATATVGASIRWYSVQTGGLHIGSGTNFVTPNITATTSYWAEALYSSNGSECKSARKEVKAVVNPLPSIGIVPDATVCEGEAIDLTFYPVPATAKLIWSNPTATVNNENGTIVTVKPPYSKGGANSFQSTYKYSVTVDDGDCKANTTVSVNVDETLTGWIETLSSQVCEGATITISALPYRAGTYEWTSQSFDGKKYTPSITESLQTSTSYNLFVTRGKCTESDAIFIEVNSKPVVAFIDSTGARDREIVFVPEFGTPPFMYGIDNKEPDNNPVKYNVNFGLHTFYIVDDAGCRSDEVSYIVLPPKLVIPPYFSPNGDGINDRWEIELISDIYPNAVITIYDRFGKLLVRYKGSDMGWDGTYLGKSMPTTDYWYVIDIDEINKQYIGHFTLIRE